jgi:hypothetical protein
VCGLRGNPGRAFYLRAGQPSAGEAPAAEAAEPADADAAAAAAAASAPLSADPSTSAAASTVGAPSAAGAAPAGAATSSSGAAVDAAAGKARRDDEAWPDPYTVSRAGMPPAEDDVYDRCGCTTAGYGCTTRVPLAGDAVKPKRPAALRLRPPVRPGARSLLTRWPASCPSPPALAHLFFFYFLFTSFFTSLLLFYLLFLLLLPLLLPARSPAALKQVLWALFSAPLGPEGSPRLDYRAVLLYLCADRDAFAGIKKAFSVVTANISSNARASADQVRTPNCTTLQLQLHYYTPNACACVRAIHTPRAGVPDSLPAGRGAGRATASLPLLARGGGGRGAFRARGARAARRRRVARRHAAGGEARARARRGGGAASAAAGGGGRDGGAAHVQRRGRALREAHAVPVRVEGRLCGHAAVRSGRAVAAAAVVCLL